MAWAYVPISAVRRGESCRKKVLMADSKLGTAGGFGVCLSFTRLQASQKLRIRQETGLFVGKGNRNGSSNSRIRFPIAAGESHEAQGEQLLFDYWLPEMLFRQLLHTS
jgi:hypothetical protein